MILNRFKQNEDFTLGKLFLNPEENIFLYTLELPYRDNKSLISCIPEGEYIVRKYLSTTFGKCLKVENNNKDECIQLNQDGSVRQIRKNIRIHTGNSVRNFIDEQNYKWNCDSNGCILVGMSCDEKQGLVYESKKALNILLKFMENKNSARLLVNYSIT